MTKLKINEIFGETIQGEGPFVGRRSVFIRLFGCPAPHCEWCDTKYSWAGKEYKEMSIKQIVKEVKKKTKDALVVISGGEPFMQKGIYSLIFALIDECFQVQVETSGKSEMYEHGIMNKVTVVMSPKFYNNKLGVIDAKTLYQADYYKFVVEDQQDIDMINEVVKFHNLNKKDIFLMPQGATREEQLRLMPYVEELAIKNGYHFSPRLHVLTHDTKRGV